MKGCGSGLRGEERSLPEVAQSVCDEPGLESLEGTWTAQKSGQGLQICCFSMQISIFHWPWFPLPSPTWVCSLHWVYSTLKGTCLQGTVVGPPVHNHTALEGETARSHTQGALSQAQQGTPALGMNVALPIPGQPELPSWAPDSPWAEISWVDLGSLEEECSSLLVTAGCLPASPTQRWLARLGVSLAEASETSHTPPYAMV